MKKNEEDDVARETANQFDKKVASFLKNENNIVSKPFTSITGKVF